MAATRANTKNVAFDIEKESKALVDLINGSDKRIQAYLVAEIEHIEKDRNTTRLNNFFGSIKKSGTRVDAMRKFIGHFASVKVVGDKFSTKDISARENQDFREVIELARKTNWTKFKPASSTELKEFDYGGTATSFLRKMFEQGYSFDRIEEILEEVKLQAAMDARKALEKAQAAARKAERVLQNAPKSLDHLPVTSEESTQSAVVH